MCYNAGNRREFTYLVQGGVNKPMLIRTAYCVLRRGTFYAVRSTSFIGLFTPRSTSFYAFQKGLIMSTQVTLTLPDELYDNANQWAVLTKRDLAETLTDALRMVLTPVHIPSPVEKSVSRLSDAEVLALAQVKMEPTQGKQMSRLLAKQREDELTTTEQSQLLALMQVYNQLWLRQSEVLAEAVRRGLRGPLTQ